MSGDKFSSVKIYMEIDQLQTAWFDRAEPRRQLSMFVTIEAKVG